MPSLTIRNIPENVMKKIRMRSEIEKRSLNSEILLIIENGLEQRTMSRSKKPVSRETRTRLWKRISGKWEDDRKTEEIIDDIYKSRSKGRDFSL
ncbi:MAG: FitA-like ribbon-helix-helix domain-containing protein [Spirochaetota bacterium]